MERAHAREVLEVLEALASDAAKGLSSKTAAERLEKHGRNELPEGKRPSLFLLFLKQFHSGLTYVLFVAAGISLAAGEYNDAAGIFIAVLIDAVFGFVQERRAENAIEKLREMVVHEVSVMRDGEAHRIPTASVVPGDIVLLEEGDKVPADARVLAEKDLRTNESALTGESSTVHKGVDPVPEETVLPDMSCMVWMGTTVASGNAKVIVTSTGTHTAFGDIATSLRNIKDERTPLEDRMDRLGRRFGTISIVLAVLVFVFGWYQGTPIGEMFFFAVALVVSVIPEGLPAVLALVLAIGVHRMAKRNAIIRHVPSVETLGVTDVICTDKTGTLTENKMTVRTVFMPDHEFSVSGEGWEPDGEFSVEGRKVRPAESQPLYLLLKAAALTNRASLVRRDGRADIIGDPTEGALVVLAAKAGLDKNELLSDLRIVDEVPFNSSRRFRSILTEERDIHGVHSRRVYAVGAYEVLVERCDTAVSEGTKTEITSDLRERFDAGNEAMAGRALRVLAIAYRDAAQGKDTLSDDDVEGLTLLGIVGMMDPPRSSVMKAIADCRRAGVRVIMATGDQKPTAVAVAKEVGLLTDGDGTDSRVFTAAEVAKMDDAEFARAVDTAAIFARVTPDTKLRIVEALQEKGHVVAMTGDGVNDAPALKRSSIGVAMGITGTEVSREVADMVLADDNFVSIVNAIEEGRVIFRNVKQTVAYLFMTNVGEVVTVLASMIAGLPLPLLPAQILWMNLVTDGFPDVALATEPARAGVLDEPPRKRDAPVLTRNTIMLTVITSSVMCVGTLGLFVHSLATDGESYARTVAFTAMAVFQLWNVFNMRSLRESVFALGPFSNFYVTGAVILSLGLQLAVLYLPPLQRIFETEPLDLAHWVTITLVSSTVFVVVEAYKVLVRKKVIPSSWL